MTSWTVRETKMTSHRPAILVMAIVISFAATVVRAQDGPDDEWRRQRDRLIERLDAAHTTVQSFGTGWTSLYEVALPWYAKWGGRDNAPISSPRVTDPETYVEELATALESGRNFFAEHVGAVIPCWFEATLDDGRRLAADYLLSLPEGFPEQGRKFPLVIRLGGSGDIRQKISFMRGEGQAGPVFSVKPIDQRGPWRIDFLNAYLDDLIARLPIDPDRVYLEGHSLGAIATWLWALENPERFAAIAPRSGWGEPYRASRLANVPAWAIHGERDETVSPVLAELMISALREHGAEARYSLLKGVQHNIPNESPGFNYQDVMDWYLSHTRSTAPVPADPRDALNIGADGVSPVEIMVVPGGRYWSAPRVDRTGALLRSHRDFKALYEPLRRSGNLASGPVRERILDPLSPEAAYLLRIPADGDAAAETAGVEVIQVPERRVARFYVDETSTNADAHVAAVRQFLAQDGIATTGEMWITMLSPRGFDSRPITECWLIIE
jgi:pimeloyl-ACP methyl ester carboxylesterase